MLQLEQLGISLMDFDEEVAAWVQFLSARPLPALQCIDVWLHWKSRVRLTPQLSALLPDALPSLTSLCFDVHTSASFVPFPRLPALRCLDMSLDDTLSEPVHIVLVRLARAIRACHGLQELALSTPEFIENNNIVMGSALLASCLAGLPQLRSLRIEAVKLTSLSFLSRTRGAYIGMALVDEEKEEAKGDEAGGAP
jgi:hypothetical protein